MIFIWGAIQFAAGAPLQSRIVDQAAAAPNLASTLNQGAFNFGNAAGASLGGMMLTVGLPTDSCLWLVSSSPSSP